jgi:hypothetical protein
VGSAVNSNVSLHAITKSQRIELHVSAPSQIQPHVYAYVCDSLLVLATYYYKQSSAHTALKSLHVALWVKKLANLHVTVCCMVPVLAVFRQKYDNS